AWQAEQEQAHARELEVNDLRHRRDSLCARLQEDYQLDLAALHAQAAADGSLAEKLTAPPAEPDAASVEDEIAELKKKIARLGNVNLEALQELAELEVRASTL